MGQQLQCAHIIITREYPSIEITTGVTDFLCSFCAPRHGLIQREHIQRIMQSIRLATLDLNLCCIISAHTCICVHVQQNITYQQCSKCISHSRRIVSADAFCLGKFYINNTREWWTIFHILLAFLASRIRLLTSLGCSCVCVWCSVVIVPRFG